MSDHKIKLSLLTNAGHESVRELSSDNTASPTIALPHRKVIALASDGDILLELGILLSMGKENLKNLVVFVNGNESYHVSVGIPR